MTTTPNLPPPDSAFCAFCGGPVPVMAAIVYHGVVYHPVCVEPTTGRSPAPAVRGDVPSEIRRDQRRRR